MEKYSDKYLNLRSLNFIVDADPSLDSVILLTNFGFIIGELVFDFSENSSNVSNLISKIKSEVIESIESDIIGDGSVISVKNAIVKYSSGMTLNFEQFTVHCEDVVGFAPINKKITLDQLSQH